MKSHRLLISLTEEEHRFIRKAAKAEGVRLGLKMPVATYIRRAAVFAARSQPDTDVTFFLPNGRSGAKEKK